jgi:putative Mg2+ transporter-C (MgtC) family protein
MLPKEDITAVSRMASQIITGVGFLCAGVVLHEGLNIRGLNTAATLWCSVAVGMFAGMGYFVAAAILAFGIVFANLILRPIVALINTKTPDGHGQLD